MALVRIRHGASHLVSARWASYRFYVDSLSGDEKGRHAQALQGIAITGTVIILVWPGNFFFKPMRKAFGRSVLQILTPSFSQQITFSDVILADILTSYARVFGDVWLTACFLVPRKEHHTWWNGKGSIVVPLLIMFPYAIRFRQCISEYCVSQPDKTGTRSKRPIWNAVKYASAFPVIWLSAWFAADQGESAGMYMLWLGAVCVNSFYSFWWDVTNDWGLSLLQPGNMGSVKQVASNAYHLHRRGASSYAPIPSEEDDVPMSTLHTNEKGAATTLNIPNTTGSTHRGIFRRWNASSAPLPRFSSRAGCTSWRSCSTSSCDSSGRSSSPPISACSSSGKEVCSVWRCSRSCVGGCGYSSG